MRAPPLDGGLVDRKVACSTQIGVLWRLARCEIDGRRQAIGCMQNRTSVAPLQ